MKQADLTMICLAAVLLVFSSAVGSEDLPIRGFDPGAYESSVSMADKASDPGSWMSAAKEYAQFAEARWEREASVLYGDPGLMAEDGALLKAWLDEDLALRFGTWLRDRFFGREAANIRGIVSAAFRAADDQYLYASNPDGTPVRDESGNPVYVRPGDSTSLESDRDGWDAAASAAVTAALTHYRTRLEALYPELLSYVHEGDTARYERAIASAARFAEGRVVRELDALAAREERLFIARRTADVWSLRKKSEGETATAIAESLAAETSRACDAGIASLEEKIASASAGADDITIAGEEWLADFSRQFEKGLAAWKDAEERFMISRLEWERGCAESFDKGNEAWAGALARLSEERRAWESRVGELLRSGEQSFADASDALEESIRNARTEFELAAAERDAANAERADAWVDIYTQAGTAASGAREAAGYWLSRLGSGAPAFSDANLAEWLRAEATRPGISSQRADLVAQALECVELYGSYTEKAMDARARLIEDFSLAMGEGTGSLLEILDEGADSDVFHLDEYQVELLRAKATEGYWTRRVDLARAVLQYASDLGSGRATESDSVRDLEAATATYDAALRAYRESEERLRQAGTIVARTREAMASAMSDLAVANATLEEAQAAYSILVGALATGDASYIEADIASRYRDLVVQSGLSAMSGAPNAASLVATYLEKARAMGYADDIERAGEALRSAIDGVNDEPSLAQLSAAWKRIFAPDDPAIAPLDADGYGLDPSDPYYACLSAALSEMRALVDASASPEARESLRMEYRGRATLIAGTAKAVAAAALESRLDAIALLVAPDVNGWYASRAGSELASIPGSSLEQRLQSDVRRRSSLLIQARARLESAALGIVLGRIKAESATADERNLASWWSGGADEASAIHEALGHLILYIDERLEDDGASFDAGIEELAKGEPLIAPFLRGKGFFVAAGFDAGRAFCGTAEEALARARGRLAAYQRYGSSSVAAEHERMESAIADLDAALADLGVRMGDDGVLPSPQDIVRAVCADGGDPSAASACLIAATDRAAGAAPAWMADELAGWKESILAYAAVKSLETGSVPARSAAMIERDVAELRTRVSAIGTMLAEISGGGPVTIRGLCNAAADLSWTPRELELIESEASRRVASSLFERGMESDLLADGEPDWRTIESVIASDASSRFGFANERIRGLAVSAALDGLRARDALAHQRDPDFLDGAALQARLEQIWSSVDERQIVACASLATEGIARIAYSMQSLVFGPLAAIDGGADRGDLISLITPGPEGEPSWLDDYYASEGQDAGSYMQVLLEIACGDESGSWTLESSRCRVDSYVSGCLADARAYRGSLSENKGGAALVAERLLSIHVARLSPDVGCADWVLEKLGLELPGDVEELLANSSMVPVAEAFLGLGSSPYAGQAAASYMNALASAGDTALFMEFSERAGAAASARGLELLQRASAASSFAGDYSGDILSWAFRNRPDDPAAAIALVRFLETASADPESSPEGPNDPFIRWIVGTLYANAEALTSDANRASARLEFVAERERVSASVYAAEASGKEHWRQYLELAAASDRKEGGGSGGTRVPAPLAPGDPEGEALAAPRSAASWMEGLVADACERAQRRSASLAAAFASWNVMIADRLDLSNPACRSFSEFSEAASTYLSAPDALFDETLVIRASPHLRTAYRNARSEYLSLEYRSDDSRNAIARLGEAISMSSDEVAMAARVAELGEGIDAARIVHDEAMVNYRETGCSYDAASDMYDAAYSVAKALFRDQEEARNAFEKEEAIRRWAGTAYLDSAGGDGNATGVAAYRSPAAELSYAEASLARAVSATAVLASLYGGETETRPYEDPEYAAAYEAYKESYRLTLLTARARTALGGALEKEYQKNDIAYDAYRESVYGGPSPLASVQDCYSAYSFPADAAEAVWTDFLTLKADGRVGLSYDNAFRLTAVDSGKASSLSDYYGAPSGPDGSADIHESTRYERDIRNWSGRVSGYMSDPARFETWSLARDHLVESIVRANPEFPGLASGVTRADNLYATVGQMRHGGNTVAELLETHQSGELAAARRAAWNSLGALEKADLEFLIVVTLTGGASDAKTAFAATGRLAEYEEAGTIAKERIDSSRSAARAFSVSGAAFWALGVALSWTPAGPVFLGLATVQFGLSAIASADAAEWQAAKTASIDPQTSVQAQAVRTGVSGLTERAAGVRAAYAAYADSCSRVESMRGVSRGGIDAALDFRASLEASDDLGAGDVESLVEMYRRFSAATGYAYTGAPDALADLYRWNSDRHGEARIAMERAYISDEESRLAFQADFRETLNRYMDGTAGVGELEPLARGAFGDRAASGKAHLARMAEAIADQALSVGRDPTARDSTEAACLYAGLLTRASASRHAAEFAAREAEWDIRRMELNGRRLSWLQASSLILERGRADFDLGEDTLRERAKAWSARFVDEYASRKPAWEIAREDMLEEKLGWVARATETAADSSSGAMLALVGSDAEAASRRMDSFSVSSVSFLDESAATFDEVMAKAGVRGMEAAMRRQGAASLASPGIVGPGLAAAGFRDSGGVIVAAAEFAESSRELLSGAQARLLASRARAAAGAALESLGESVRSANEGFENGMDEVFTDDGAWKRQGGTYVKDVVVHSTVGMPLITERASVEAFTFFAPGVWRIRTDLSDGRLAGLGAESVRALIASAQDEVRAKSDEIFGAPEDGREDAIRARGRRFDVYRKERGVTGRETLTWTDDEGRTSTRTVDIYGIKEVFDHAETRTEGAGTFGRYIGYAPVMLYGANPDGGMNGVFQSEGSGELGRLMASYIYWSLREGKGWSEVSKPIYEKDLWDDRNDWLQAPTIRGIADMGMTAASGILTGGLGTFAMNLADDALFGMLDISGGYRSWEETGLDFGKKAAMSALNFAGGSLFGGGLPGIPSSGPGAAIGSAMATGIRTASAGLVSGAIGAVDLRYGDNGDVVGLLFDRERFSDAVFGETSIASGLGAAAGAAFGTAVDHGGAFTARIWSGFASLGTMAVTEGAEYAAHLGYSAARGVRGTAMFEDAWENHGGITLDVANVGSLLGVAGFLSGITGAGYDARNRAEAREIAAAFRGAGLSLTIGPEGVSGTLGGGGYDIVDMGLGIGKGLALGARLDAYAGKHGSTMREVLETAYGYGDFAAEETVWRIALGADEARVESGDGKARTIASAYGGRAIRLSSAYGEEASLDLAVTLQHEAWRDGLTGDPAGQGHETWRAARAHTEMAISLARGSEHGAAMARLIGGDREYQRDIGAYLGGGFGSYVSKTYDSSDDYWKLTMDGKLLNDGKARLLAEIVNDDGTTGWELVSGSEAERSTAASLVHYLGSERSMELFGGSLSDLSRYDDQTLGDVLNLDDVDIKTARRNPGEAERLIATATAAQRERLLGEALMKGFDIAWSDDELLWTGDGTGIPLSGGGIHGNAAIRSIGPLLYERFSITSDIERREGAYDVWKDGVKGQVGSGNTRLAFTKWDIDSGEQIGTILAGGAWNSVDNAYGQLDSSGHPIGEDQRYRIAFGPTLQGNTIARGALNLRWAQARKADWGDVFILSDTSTISGETIASDGRRPGHPYDYRWLAHATQFGSSDGCLVYRKGDDTVDQFEALVRTLGSWGLYQGYSIAGQLSDLNDFAYRFGYGR